MYTQAQAEKEARIKEEVTEIKKTFYCDVSAAHETHRVEVVDIHSQGMATYRESLHMSCVNSLESAASTSAPAGLPV
jgi:hypothetical protein